MNLKPRLDELLVERGFFANVHDAQAAVLAGQVVVGEHAETSAGRRLKPDTPLRVKGRREYVSRGAHKLLAALDASGVSVEGLRCADLGCSTGGFTDVLLRAGAAQVAAIDVGYGQFDWGLRNDERVHLFERTNIRGLLPEQVGGPFDLAVADLSFISLKTVLPDVARLLKPGGRFISLVKPQFEAAPDELGEGGVVRSAETHLAILTRVADSFAAHHFICEGLTHSPITGPQGNIEFLLWARLANAGQAAAPHELERTVNCAHQTFEV